MAPVWRWNRKKEEAAALIAVGDLGIEELCRRVGCHRNGLRKWRLHPDFQQRVAEIQAELAAAISGRGIVELRNRVDALNERWLEMRRLMEERKVQYARVPGGDTGLLVRVGARGQGSGARGRSDAGQMGLWDGEEGRGEEGTAGRGEVLAVDDGMGEYQVDGVLLDALLKVEKQAAEELGQWRGERDEGPTVLIRNYVGFDLEKV